MKSKEILQRQLDMIKREYQRFLDSKPDVSNPNLLFVELQFRTAMCKLQNKIDSK